MKRLLALALTLITVFSLAECGNNKNQSKTTNTENSNRSPGYATIYAAIVDYNETVHNFGHGVSHDKNVVRPALWINADSQNP